MRRRRMHSRRSGSRRNKFWNGLWFCGGANFDSTPPAVDGEVLTIWSQWPAGLSSDGSETSILRTGLVEPIDMTLIKTRASVNALVRVSTGPVDKDLAVQQVWGITVLEDNDPNTLENQISEAGPYAPIPPALPGTGANDDWVWRQVVQGVIPAGADTLLAEAAPDQGVYDSKARRKLKIGQGLLLVYQIIAVDSGGDGGYNFDCTLTCDIRHLFLSGSYATNA